MHDFVVSSIVILLVSLFLLAVISTIEAIKSIDLNNDKFIDKNNGGYDD